MIRTTLAAFLALGALAAAPAPASAQSWGVNVGFGGPSPVRYDPYRGGYRMRHYICSGTRAHQLERRLRHEVREGDIDRYRARRIHKTIDRIEDDQRYACSRRGDWGDVREVARRYDRIEGWIATAERRGGGYYARGW